MCSSAQVWEFCWARDLEWSYFAMWAIYLGDVEDNIAAEFLMGHQCWQIGMPEILVDCWSSKFAVGIYLICSILHP